MICRRRLPTRRCYPGYFKGLAMDSKPLKLDYVFAHGGFPKGAIARG